MKQRFDLSVIASAGYKALLGVHSYVQNSGLNHGLLELVKIRVSRSQRKQVGLAGGVA